MNAPRPHRSAVILSGAKRSRTRRAHREAGRDPLRLSEWKRGKWIRLCADSGTRSRFGFASRPPLGRVRLRKHHTVMFSPLRMTAKGQTSPFQRNNIPRAGKMGTYHFTNPPVFVRERPKTGGFKHTEMGLRIFASKAKMPFPLWEDT